MSLSPVFRTRCPLAFVVAAITILSCFGRGEEKGLRNSLLGDKTWVSLVAEYSGELAAKHVQELSRFHRISGGSPGYHQAVEYVADFMKSQGYEVAIDEHISDGEKTYLLWRSMPGWDVRRAELRISDTGEVLSRYSETPTGLFEYSNGADVTAPAVFAGRGIAAEDYRGIDVSGKIVLATGDGDAVHREAVLKRGAAGVVVGPPDNDALCAEFQDLVRVQRLKNNKALRDKTRFGFSLSFQKFQRLRSLLSKGANVRLTAQVEARQFDAEAETVSAFLKGSRYPGEEIILTAHLDHYSPGANDNASGSGSLLEIARTLMALVRQGAVEKPRRSIRFLWMGEMHGFAGYLAKDTSIGNRGVAALNLDMVGEDIHKTRSVMSLIRTPLSNPGFVADLSVHMLEQVDAMNLPGPSGETRRLHYRILDFKGGSDHFMLSDPTIGVPCVNLGHDDDIFHHTSLDDWDKIDVHELRRAGLIAAGAVLFAANADEEEALHLALEISAKGKQRLSEQARGQAGGLHDILQDGSPGPRVTRILDEADIFIDARTQAEIKSMVAAARLSGTPRALAFVEGLAGSLKNHAALVKADLRRYAEQICSLKKIQLQPAGLSEDESEMKKIIPKRLFRGPLSQFYFEDLLGEDIDWYIAYGKSDPAWVTRRAEILNFMDGRRSLLDIYHFVSAEMGRSDKGFYKKFLSDLKKHGLATY